MIAGQQNVFEDDLGRYGNIWTEVLTVALVHCLKEPVDFSAPAYWLRWASKCRTEISERVAWCASVPRLTINRWRRQRGLATPVGGEDGPSRARSSPPAAPHLFCIWSLLFPFLPTALRHRAALRTKARGRNRCGDLSPPSPRDTDGLRTARLRVCLQPVSHSSDTDEPLWTCLPR